MQGAERQCCGNGNSKETFVTMDRHETPEYKLSSKLLSAVGLWPYETCCHRLCSLTVAFFGFSGFCVPQILYCVQAESTEHLFVALSFVVGSFICLSKGIGFLYYSKEIKHLLNAVKNDWANLRTVDELKILQKYAKRRAKFIFSYTAILYVSGFFYILLPLSSKFKNESSPEKQEPTHYIVYPAIYFIDDKKYYYQILLHEGICFYISTTVVLGVDTLYVVLVEHVCGMFAILSKRLEYDSTTTHGIQKIPDNCGEHIKRCVQLHVEIISLIQYIETVFTMTSLLDVSCGILLQAGAFMMAGFTDAPFERARYSGIAVGQLFRLFYNSWPGQDLINHSLRVNDSIYLGLWYEKSLKIQKLFPLFMRRAQISCKLTIGKLYEYNYNSFLTVAKTSLSYCTIMVSVNKGQDNQIPLS